MEEKINCGVTEVAVSKLCNMCRPVKHDENMDRNYMNLTITIFKFIKIWGECTPLRVLCTGILLFSTLSASLLFSCTIIVSWGNFQQMANAGIFSMAFMKIFLSILHAVKHKEMILNLIYMLRNDIYCIEKELSPPFGFLSNSRIEKLNNACMKIIITITTTAVSMMTFFPLVMRLTGNKSDATEDIGASIPVRIALPYNMTNSLNYEAVYSFELFILTFGPFCSYCVSCVYITFMTHIIVRFKNLREALMNNVLISMMPNNKMSSLEQTHHHKNFDNLHISNKSFAEYMKPKIKYGKINADNYAEYDKIKINLKSCIRYHQELLRFCREFDHFCGPQLAIDLMAGMTILCVIGFQLSVLPTVEFRFVVYLLAGAFNCINILIHCWLNSELAFQSGTISTAAYMCLSWDLNKDCKTYLFIMMSRATKPIAITMYKIFTVNLGTFFQVMKVAYSNYALLKELNYEKQAYTS